MDDFLSCMRFCCQSRPFPARKNRDIQTQTDVTTDLIDIKEKEFVNTNHMLYKLQKEISLLHPGTREWFASEEKVKFYTGLPNIEILDALFVYISESITSSARSALTKYQMLSLTLMRLRLNLAITDLAYRFNVTQNFQPKMAGFGSKMSYKTENHS